MAYISFKPKDYFNTLTYTGNESAGHAITGVGFQPDFVWFKNRGATDSHSMYDVVRGATKQLESDTNGAETTESTGLASFDSDGFTVGTRTASNSNNMSICSWNWKTTNSQGSANSDGSVTTTYTSANTTAGISISKFTATGSTMTFGHGLGVAPSSVWVKRTDAVGNGAWMIYQKDMTAGSYLRLDDNSAKATDNTRFGGVEPTSSVVTVSTELLSGGEYVAYCFVEKSGFFNTGIYFGNGNNDGSYIYTGFKPAWVMVKQETGTQGWLLQDSVRNNPSLMIGNPIIATLFPSSNAAESTSGFNVDFHSNGFKVKSTDHAHNANNNSYVYWAFAEEPLVSSNKIPATAR